MRNIRFIIILTIKTKLKTKITANKHKKQKKRNMDAMKNKGVNSGFLKGEAVLVPLWVPAVLLGIIAKVQLLS
jgi:hypothetical protein